MCPACGEGRAWVLGRRHLWECADCHRQTSVTAATVVHGTRTPLRVWFWVATWSPPIIRGSQPSSCSVSLASRAIETAWLISQKLRRAIVASERARLKNVVEVDEFFLGGSLAGSWEWSVCSRSRREQ